MAVAIVIPARFASSRYPGKPLVPLRGATGIAKPLIRRSWEAACGVAGVERVVVATDDLRIAREVEDSGGDVVMTRAECHNGSERCAAALSALGDDIGIVVNLQGDAPLTPPSYVEALIDVLAADSTVQVATPAMRTSAVARQRLLEDQRAGRVGGTTVTKDAAGDALYFSKAVIPHGSAASIGEPGLPLLHVGVYAYRRAALQAYAALPAGTLELLEGLEQLRFLEAGIKVRVVEVAENDVWELNNPEDVTPIEAALAARQII